MKKSDYTKETLLDVLGSYARMIDRNGEKFSMVVLDDIRKSIKFVLKINEYDGKYKDILEESAEEICPHCDHINEYKVSEAKDYKNEKKIITCQNCGSVILACSLCDGNGCGKCSL